MEEVKKNKKYDWVALKQEFFNSDFLSAFNFMKQKIGVRSAQNGNVKRHIIGWIKEKEAWRWQQFMEARKGTK